MILKKITVGVSLLVLSAGSFASDGGSSTPSAAKAAFDQLTSQATEFSAYGWGLAVVIVGATVGIKLFKKFVNRAS
ncbi:major coat protein [Xenorhabdus sp. BG5]|uniref:major coat protein n=1 Tax=Xenorhabdus sp. BG5 TaxID=2782014 RepID=UPI0018804F4E|nr:major coat protein [Xenorhabdus sp. BG5]MBE8595038.1 phage coat protein [Xenorhabdus sp. BG5]